MSTTEQINSFRFHFLLKIKCSFAILAILFSLAPSLVAVAQDFTQGYSSDETLLLGSIVALSDEDNNKVEAISSERAKETLGIVVRDNDSAVTLTDDRTGVFVVTSGRFEILAASSNGAIRAGDRLSVSSIRGVGMLSDELQSHMIGIALEDLDFTDPADILSQTTVTDSEGNETVIGIGRVLTEIAIGPNPDRLPAQTAPDFLVNFTETIIGKPVSSVRIYAGVAIMAIATIMSGSLLYSAVRSSIISIGRNPLSRKSVLAGLAQVVIISLIIFISGLIAVYLILKI